MDLGRSSHIHITTWGTLSRQKKEHRSMGAYRGALPSTLCSRSPPSTASYRLYPPSFCSFFSRRRPPPPPPTTTTLSTYKGALSRTRLKKVGLFVVCKTSYHLQRLCKTNRRKIKKSKGFRVRSWTRGTGRRSRRRQTSRRVEVRRKKRNGTNEIAKFPLAKCRLPMSGFIYDVHRFCQFLSGTSQRTFSTENF